MSLNIQHLNEVLLEYDQYCVFINWTQTRTYNYILYRYDYVNIVLGNDLVPSEYKPLPESMLTKLRDAIWQH